MRRPRAHTTLLITCIAACLAAGLGIRKASAQEADRDAAYAALDAEVAALAQHGMLLKRVARLTRPSVVHLEARKEGAAGTRRSLDEAGSGVIVNIAGAHYVITNLHVVRNARLADVHIRLEDGRELNPVRVWGDPETDIAVLSISADRLTPARLGDSRKVEIGDFVLAVGSPFGLSYSVTFGIVSAKGRRDLELGDDSVRIQDFLQTDAAINPGNSGGPLLNLRGEVVGVNTAIASNSGGSEGIGFAIPINMVMVIAQQLVETGAVSRAYLGVQLDSRFSAEDARALGLNRRIGTRISGITPNSPAEASRLRVNDVILKYDGVDVEDDGHLVNLVSITPAARVVELVIFRSGRETAVQAKLGNRRNFEPQQ